jgi:hypothetical protein
MPRRTTLLVLALSTLLTGAAIAQPGATPVAPPSAPVDPYLAPRADQPDQLRRGPADRMGRQRMGQRAQGGKRMGQAQGQRRLPPALRARLLQRFDQNGDGRLTGPERRAAKRFVRHLRQQARRTGGGRGAAGAMGPGGFGPR